MSAPRPVLTRPTAAMLWSAALGLLVIVATSLLVMGARGVSELDRMIDRDLEALVLAYEADGSEGAQNLMQDFTANRFALLPDFHGTLTPAGTLSLDASRSERGFVALDDDGPRLRARAVRVATDLDMVAGRSLGPLLRDLAGLAMLLTLAAAAAMALAWVLLERSRRDVSRRVGAVATAMQEVGRTGRIPHMPQSGTDDELDYIAGAAGEMAQALLDRAASHRDFSEQLAHELRTPLARLSSSLPANDEDDDEVDTIRRRILDVSQTLGDMLELASIRNDRGFARDLTPMDPVDIVQGVCDLFEDVADDRDIRLDLQASGPLTVDMQDTLFRRLVVNLIDNALQHTPHGGRIVLSIDPTADIVLRVSNPGAGFPDALVESGPSRFSAFDGDAQRPGHGLGLAFVDAIADYHGWTLELANEAGRAVATVRRSAQ